MMGVDGGNNTYVASYVPFGWFVTSKFDPQGTLTTHYEATWLAVDPTGGGVVVTGRSVCCAGGTGPPRGRAPGPPWIAS